MTGFHSVFVVLRDVAARFGLLLLCVFLLGASEPPTQAQVAREANGPQRTCPGCNLAGYDFSNRTLDRANLANANLSGANFTGATLKGVVLSGANLKGANFTGAHIELGGARTTNMVNADLSNANFTGASLTGADLQYANISCANFTDADMTGVIAGQLLRQSSPACKAKFTGARLSCSLAALSGRFGFSGAHVPTCASPNAKTQAKAAVASDWSCPNTDLSGLATLIYVSPTGQDTASCGLTSSSPCLTISQGLAQCTGSSCGVLAYYGAYSPTGTINLASGKSIYGGCVTGTASPSNFSIVNAPAGGVPAIAASSVSSSTLQGLSIVGSAVPASPAKAQASVAVEIAGSTVALNYVSITGAAGGNGAAGAAGTKGAAGTSASGKTAGTNTTCNASGGAGGPGMSAHVDYGAFSLSGCTTTCGSTTQTNSNCSGGSCSGPQLTQCNGSPGSSGSQSGGYGGSAGGSGAAYCNFSYCNYSTNSGNSGGPGASGSCGASGLASQNINGSYVNGAWTASVGGTGLAGGNGSGGGGGGGGQAYGGVCVWVQSDSSGGNGGGGGAGSCGATPGLGGQQGGASIALAVTGQSTIALNTVTIVGGAGGTGGIGGNGAGAVTGGTGANGASGDASNGGSGKAGGWGGSSGAGAGGNGGPSFGAVFVSAPEANMTTTRFYIGISGGVGAAGNIANVSGAPCQSTDAALGLPGRVTDYASFN